ncbi:MULTISPECIES: type 1 glutamine amidotransferase [unclassified Streptomyces]|uniref:type 1 glutamine amidotransferase n=1 Tax=unclassified Streptomyces TaxID=2593676 RepID=UPI00365FC80C
MAGDPVPDTLAGAVALVVRGGPAAAYEEFTGRAAELALPRAALAAEVPVPAVCLGAQLLAIAAGGRARPGEAGAQIGWGEVRTGQHARTDALFADVPERLRVLHWHGDTMDLPAGATLLASCDRYPVQAFRIAVRPGGSSSIWRWTRPPSTPSPRPFPRRRPARHACASPPPRN